MQKHSKKASKSKMLPRKTANQSRAKSTISSIIEATTHILEKFGAEKINTNFIAEVAGVSIGSLYQYFPSKESIISVLIDKFIDYKKKRVDEVLLGKSYQTIDELIAAIVDILFENFKSENKLQQLIFQNLFTLKQFEKIKVLDNYIIELIKKVSIPFHGQIRQEHLDLSLFLIYHSARTLPLAIFMQGKSIFSQETAKKEIVYLVKRYMLLN